MAWTTDPQAPIVRHGRWTPDPTAPEPPPPGAWRPIPGRIGSELLDLDEWGAIVASTTGRELLDVDEYGTATVPALQGAEFFPLAELGRVGPSVRGAEDLTVTEYLTGGLAFAAREWLSITEFGVATVPALRGAELADLTESGPVGPVGRGLEAHPLTEQGEGYFVTQTAVSHSVTTTGGAYIDIPVWCSWIDAILLGGGGGGAGGRRQAFVVGGDGNGGGAGGYGSYRWDRGAGRNLWRRLYILLGVGGAGGTRNNNGPGGAGGATELWIDDWSGWTGQYLAGPGGAAGTGNTFGGGLSGAQAGKAPGNHTFEGMTMTGGGQNSGVPGAGGEGGGGSIAPFNAGSGSAGARGQALIRFSM